MRVEKQLKAFQNTASEAINKQSGFSLVELLAVVAIILVLTSLALAGYGKFATRSARLLAQAKLLQIAADMENHFSVNLSYKHIDADSYVLQKDMQTRYRLQIDAQETSFVITALPKGPQTNDGALWLNQAGVQRRYLADVAQGSYDEW